MNANCELFVCKCDGKRAREKRGTVGDAGVEKETAWKKYTLSSSEAFAN